MIWVVAKGVKDVLKGEEAQALRDLENNTGGDLNIVAILNFVYSIAGVIAVAFIVFGGIQYSTAQGDPGKVRKAGQTLAFAIIGLIIVLLATVFTNFIFTSV